jgi:maltose alpha-D-glucosyltransferase/alpha-amylase
MKIQQLDNDRRKIEAAHCLLLTLPGSPILYYGDEIGMGDNIWLPDRNGVRTPMQVLSRKATKMRKKNTTKKHTPITTDPSLNESLVSYHSPLSLSQCTLFV